MTQIPSHSNVIIHIPIPIPIATHFQFHSRQIVESDSRLLP